VKLKEEPKPAAARRRRRTRAGRQGGRGRPDRAHRRHPTPPANYRSLTSVGARIYYGAPAAGAAGLYVYDLEKQTETRSAPAQATRSPPTARR